MRSLQTVGLHRFAIHLRRMARKFTKSCHCERKTNKTRRPWVPREVAFGWGVECRPGLAQAQTSYASARPATRAPIDAARSFELRYLARPKQAS